MHTFSNSGMINCCEHEGDCLTVTFKNGQKYKYFGVPRDTYYAFTKSESAGKFFGSEIKDKYRMERVEE